MNVFIVDSSGHGVGSIKNLVLELDGVALQGVARNCSETMESFIDLDSRRKRPDVVIVDAELDDGCSLGCMKLIRQYFPRTKIITLFRDACPIYPDAVIGGFTDYVFERSVEIKELQEILLDLSRKDQREKGMDFPSAQAALGLSAVQ